MRKSILILSCILIQSMSYAQKIVQKVGTNPMTILPSAVLEVESTTKGFLPPRMSSLQRLAIASPATGLQVYDTTTNSVWYYNGTLWVDTNPTTAAWGLTGTTGTTAATNFLGTTDATDLVFRTNNLVRMRLMSGGNISILGLHNPNWDSPIINGNVYTVTSINLSGIIPILTWTALRTGSAKLAIRAFQYANGGGFEYVIYPQFQVRDSPQQIYFNISNFLEQNAIGSYQVRVTH